MSGFLCALIVKQLFDIVQIQPQNMERIFFFFFFLVGEGALGKTIYRDYIVLWGSKICLLYSGLSALRSFHFEVSS